MSSSGNRQAVAILVAILDSIHQTKPIIDLGCEIDKSNAYMKFKRNWVINNLECP